jgi:hypothetical protein
VKVSVTVPKGPKCCGALAAGRAVAQQHNFLACNVSLLPIFDRRAIDDRAGAGAVGKDGG